MQVCRDGAPSGADGDNYPGVAVPDPSLLRTAGRARVDKARALSLLCVSPWRDLRRNVPRAKGLALSGGYT
ncbi:hypothetical protein FHT86_007448 [Rhizobium sp. BK313]|jgi:hypothetical protein|nr:hypothetical protein [Rhizobium sp. BK313]